MKLLEFDYELPKELIAQTPINPRDHSKLLILDREDWKLADKKFFNLLDELWENDVLVLNNTKVIKARLKWKLENNFEVEIFLHKQINNNTWDCLVYPWKKLKPWTKVYFENSSLEAEIKEVSEKWRIVEFNKSWIEFIEIIDNVWQTPLPPYIKEKLDDIERYQTVYNEKYWSVAAPTAWLHFTDQLIKNLIDKWVKIEKVLLHVWIWTFLWVETENIIDHKMHSEFIEIEKETSEKLNRYKKEWKRIIAVWTTSVRVLESFCDDNEQLHYGQKDTNIFIYPWYNWKFVDWIITNFHLPKSTLLMLVSSFWWKENIKKAYEYAIKNKYRFFSFWDAMFIR